jgi:hypothetical protein
MRAKRIFYTRFQNILCVFFQIFRFLVKLTSALRAPMEGDLYYLKNGRRPQLFGKWTTTSIFKKSKTTQLFWQIENNLNL